MRGVKRIFALVTARGGSKGLSGKNVRLLAGRPLIAWSIKAALECPVVERVVVSTDDPVIAEAAKSAGAEVPFLRPEQLARDDTPHLAVVDHAMEWLDRHDAYCPERVLLMQPTSPFRTAVDITNAAALAASTGAPAVVGVCEAHPHPLKTYTLAPDGTLLPFVEHGIGYLRRQALPTAYADNGAIYLNSVESLRRDRTFIPAGAVPYPMPPERSVDIDSAFDFRFAEFLMNDSGRTGGLAS